MSVKAFLLAAAVTLPLQQVDNWQVLQYRKIASNQVDFSETGMTIDVDASASPIIYPLAEPIIVSRVDVRGRLSETLDLDTSRQGDGEHDDFSLKIGLVVSGDKRLSRMQVWFKPDWIVTLFGLAPEGTGIDNVHFLNAVQGPEQLNRERVHPLSELILENNVWLLDQPGRFELSHRLETPLEVIAVWLSSDGDNSGSAFTTRIESLTLTP